MKLPQMKRTAAILLSVAVAGAGLTTVAAPAMAVSQVSIAAPDIRVKGDACGSSRITITGDWSSDTYNSIDTTVTGPDGEYAGGDYTTDESSGSVYVDVELCGGYDTPGRYTVDVEVEGFDENFDNHTVVDATDTFTFTRVVPAQARTAISRKVKRAHGKYKWKVIGRLVRSGRGYARRPVTLQVVIAGDWMDIDSARTNKRGLFGWRFKPNGYKWRYVYYGSSTTKPSESAAFRTPRKGGSRREAPVDPRSLID